MKMLDARIQTMDNQADRFVTKEKKDLIVDSYIKWRISDFSRYYRNGWWRHFASGSAVET